MQRKSHPHSGWLVNVENFRRTTWGQALHKFFSPWSQGTSIINLRSLDHKYRDITLLLVFDKSTQLASRCVALQGKGRLKKLRISFSKHQLSEALEGTCASLKYPNCCSSPPERGGTTAASLTGQLTDCAFHPFLEALKLLKGRRSCPKLWDFYPPEYMVCPQSVIKSTSFSFICIVNQITHIINRKEQMKDPRTKISWSYCIGRVFCKLSCYGNLFYGKTHAKKVSPALYSYSMMFTSTQVFRFLQYFISGTGINMLNCTLQTVWTVNKISFMQQSLLEIKKITSIL